MTRLAVWWTLLPVTAPVPPPGAPGAPGTERGEEFGKTSPIALVVILLLGLATALLIRSMSKHLRKVPASFDPPAAGHAPATPPEDGTGADGAGKDGAGTDGAGTGGAGADGGARASSGRSGIDRTEGPPGTGSP